MENSYIAGEYQIMSMIGKGAFGQIWKAVNRNTGEEVAVKLEDVTTKH
jgi:casein kinase 1 epsilon